MKYSALLASLGAAALALAAPASPASPPIIATDGPGYTISISPKTVKAGTYKIIVHDRARTHNVHLIGRGVNKATDLNWVGTVTWTVKLRKGVYRYICDPHASLMHGTLRVT